MSRSTNLCRRIKSILEDMQTSGADMSGEWYVILPKYEITDMCFLQIKSRSGDNVTFSWYEDCGRMLSEPGEPLSKPDSMGKIMRYTLPNGKVEEFLTSPDFPKLYPNDIPKAFKFIKPFESAEGSQATCEYIDFKITKGSKGDYLQPPDPDEAEAYCTCGAKLCEFDECPKGLLYWTLNGITPNIDEAELCQNAIDDYNNSSLYSDDEYFRGRRY